MSKERKRQWRNTGKERNGNEAGEAWRKTPDTRAILKCDEKKGKRRENSKRKKRKKYIRADVPRTSSYVVGVCLDGLSRLLFRFHAGNTNGANNFSARVCLRLLIWNGTKSDQVVRLIFNSRKSLRTQERTKEKKRRRKEKKKKEKKEGKMMVSSFSF